MKCHICSKFATAIFLLTIQFMFQLRNIKHFPCCYTVISTRVEIGKTRNCVESLLYIVAFVSDFFLAKRCER